MVYRIGLQTGLPRAALTPDHWHPIRSAAEPESAIRSRDREGTVEDASPHSPEPTVEAAKRTPLAYAMGFATPAMTPATGAPLAPNREGLLLAKGASRMLGYLGNPALTAAGSRFDGRLAAGTVGRRMPSPEKWANIESWLQSSTCTTPRAVSRAW